jgi:uncharacterized protein (TIGR03067 family)
MASLEFNGRPVADERLKRFKLVVAGDRWTVAVDDKPVVLFKLTVEPGREPKAIDLAVAVGSTKGQTFHGIYVLDGGTLKLGRCTNPGGERPTAFVTQPGSERLLVVWKRVQP